MRVVLGGDTRESSGWISRTLAAGLNAAGAEVVYAGVMTTPGVAFLTRHHGFAAGMVVSASHNPYEDNGIKVLSEAGTTLPDSMELDIERTLSQPQACCNEAGEAPLVADSHLLDDYLDYLATLASDPIRSAKFRIVVDCAHGASSVVIPSLLARLGIQARILNDKPNGRNINLKAGSLHPQIMAVANKSPGADVVAAFYCYPDRAGFATPGSVITYPGHVSHCRHPRLK